MVTQMMYDKIVTQGMYVLWLSSHHIINIRNYFTAPTYIHTYIHTYSIIG